MGGVARRIAGVGLAVAGIAYGAHWVAGEHEPVPTSLNLRADGSIYSNEIDGIGSFGGITNVDEALKRYGLDDDIKVAAKKVGASATRTVVLRWDGVGTQGYTPGACYLAGVDIRGSNPVNWTNVQPVDGAIVSQGVCERIYPFVEAAAGSGPSGVRVNIAAYPGTVSPTS